MFSRFIKELSGLPTPSGTEYDSEEERSIVSSREQSPTRIKNQQDTGHLGPSPSPTPPPYPHQQQYQHHTSSTQRSPPKQNNQKWKSFLETAKNFIDNIIELGDDDDNDNTNKSSSKAIPPPTSPPAYYPATASSDHFTSNNNHNNYNTMHSSNSVDDKTQQPLGDTTPPTPLIALPEHHLPPLSEPSGIMEEHHIRALSQQVPLRHRQAHWQLIYSTLRDGISLQTLLRNARDKSPTVLVVRDQNKHVFGAFCSEAWKLSPRYYGTGETFVFQLSPNEVVWHWWWKKMNETQNDFFMWGASDAIAVGGAGGYALWLDNDLLQGISRRSLTFGNESLSSSEEFSVGAVEVWWLR